MEAEHLLTLLRRISRRARRLREDEETLPPGAGRLLSALRGSDGISQKDLAELLQIRPQSLTDLVLLLEREGCIEKGTDPVDRRRAVLCLTEKGLEAEKKNRAERRARAERLFAPLDECEREALEALLTKIAACEDGKENAL